MNNLVVRVKNLGSQIKEWHQKHNHSLSASFAVSILPSFHLAFGLWDIAFYFLVLEILTIVFILFLAYLMSKAGNWAIACERVTKVNKNIVFLLTIVGIWAIGVGIIYQVWLWTVYLPVLATVRNDGLGLYRFAAYFIIVGGFVTWKPRP